MNRTATIAYLQSEYAQIASDSKRDATHTSDAYGIAIDNALRALGYEESALSATDVPQTKIRPYLALLRYYVLRRFGDVLAIRVDVSVNNTMQASSSQAYKAIGELAAKAAKECAALGYPVDGDGTNATMTVGRLNIDIYEPSCSNEFGGL